VIAGMPLLLLTLAACSGGETEAPVEAPIAAVAVPPDVLSATWQVRMAAAAARAPFEGRPAWVAYFDGKRGEALAAFASENDAAALARAHAEYAAMYRQAALLAANAILQVYSADLQPSDPAEAEYLRGVSGVLLARPEEAAHLGRSGSSTVPGLAARDKAWKAWFDAPPAPVPDAVLDLRGKTLAELMSGPPGSLPGGDVEPQSAPLVGEEGEVKIGDPGVLFALSRAHEAWARAADPTAEATIDAYLNPFRLPVETRVSPTAATAADPWLFMSAYTSAADMQFAALASAGDLAGAEALAAQSAYASIAKACTREKVDADCVIEQAGVFGSAIEDAMAVVNGGQADGFHRPFSAFARAGVLRAADLYARARGEDETSGILRINAQDRNVDRARDPVFTLFLAAWDAGNRNTPRATELVHQSIDLLPGLVEARAPLDALHIRLARNSAPGVPMH
jgi:hypothetical protein